MIHLYIELEALDKDVCVYIYVYVITWFVCVRVYIWYSPANPPPSWSWSRVASKYMIDVGSTLPPAR